MRRDCKPSQKHPNRHGYNMRAMKMMYKWPAQDKRASELTNKFVDPPGLVEHIFPENQRLGKGKDGKKTLVVLIGSARGGEETWSSLYRNVLNENNADLALVFGRQVPDTDSVGEFESNSLVARAAFWWTIPELGSRWGLGLDAIILQQLRDNASDISPCVFTMRPDSWEEGENASYCSWEDVAKRHGTAFLGGTSAAAGGKKENEFNGSGAIIFYFRWVLKRMIVKHNLTSRYDRFVLTRADHYYIW
jgi:hypothetical protein